MLDEPHYSRNRPRPTTREWLLVAINTLFVVAGIVILPHEPDGAIVTIAFFGTCLVVSLGTVLRKLRDRRFAAETLAVAGGVPIRPSNIIMPLLGGWLAILGVVLFVFGHDYPLLFRAIAVFIAVVGVVVLALALMRRLPGGFLRFDPDALTIAQRRWRARIPWDNILIVHEGEYASNPMLRLRVVDLDGLDIAPAEARAAALRDIARTQALMGAEFVVMTAQYGIDLPLLAGTVARYVQDRAARAELRPRLTPP
jgi:hypothetical protein